MCMVQVVQAAATLLTRGRDRADHRNPTVTAPAAAKQTIDDIIKKGTIVVGRLHDDADFRSDRLGRASRKATIRMWRGFSPKYLGRQGGVRAGNGRQPHPATA